MNYIIINGPSGKREVIAGKPFILNNGEKVIGARTANTINELSEKTGIKLGNIIAKATKAFGIKPCSKCEQRRQILNKVSEIGIMKAVKQIGSTL